MEKAPIISIRNAQYKNRFILNEYNVATYDNIICFIPKIDLTIEQIKALLAYLNSSFVQLYIESEGVISGGGIIQLNVQDAREMPVIDPRKLKQEDLKCLAKLFDELETKARELGGADTYKNIMRLWDEEIAKIDIKIAEILGLPEVFADMARQLAQTMMERRLARTKEARPSALKGTEESPIKSRKKKKRSTDDESKQSRLTDFM